MQRNTYPIGASLAGFSVAMWCRRIGSFILLVSLTPLVSTNEPLEETNTRTLQQLFEHQGFVENVTILEKDEIEELRRKFSEYESNKVVGSKQFKSSLFMFVDPEDLKYFFLFELATHPNVVGTLKVRL